MNEEVSDETPSVVEANGVEIAAITIDGKVVSQEGVEGEDSAPVKPNRPN